MEQKIAAGELYTDAEHKIYQVVTVAVHAQTQEKLVVYQALYDNYTVYAQPTELFFKNMTVKRQSTEMVSEADKEQETINPYLLKFLDADTFDEKYNTLVEMSEVITDRLVDDIAIVLDIVVPEGPLMKRYDDLKSAVRTRQHYEFSNRLR